MKITYFKSTALLVLASLGLLTTAARAAHEGDLFLGVRATSGVGSNKDYMVNLGPASQFETGSSVTILNLGDIGADLSFLFGSTATTPWYNRPEVQWGIAGATGFNDLGSIPAKTLYASSLSSEPWQRKSGTAQGGTTTLMSGMVSAFDDGSTIGLVAPTAKSQDSTSINSWVSYTSDGPNSGNAHIAFGAFNDSIEAPFGSGAPSSVLNLYRVSPATVGAPAGTPSDLLGRLFLNISGQLTFVPAAAIGAGTVAFAAIAPTVAEDAGPLVVTLTRTGDPTFAATVELSTTDGTALAGTDYTGITSQLVSFGVGETQKTVNVNITNRNGAASDRTFALHLANPSAGLSAGSDATVTITAQITPSVIKFASATFTAREVDNTVDVILTRTGGISPVDVQISTVEGTAHAGTDYTTVTNATVSFALNATTATKTIVLSHPVGNTANKSFTVSLSNPGTNASVGAPATATVVILATDTTIPTVTISTPAPNGTITSSSVTISGYARDNIEVSEVLVSINGNAQVATTLSASGALGVPWTITPNLAQGLKGGLNTVQVVSKDSAGNTSAPVTRSFTFVEKGSLAVITKVGSTITSVGGTVPGVSALPTFYQVGKTYALTAKPAAGYVFDHWVIPGVDSSSPATQVPALSLLYTDAILASPTITAFFAATPYTAAKIGAFNGLVTPHQGTMPSNSTTGFVTVTVTSAGTFTGTLKIDGLTLSIGGLFDLTGTARFGATRSDKVLVARTNKPAVELMLHLDLAGNTAQITGTVKQYLRTTLISTSDVLADRAAFDARLNPFSTTHANYLVNRGVYTVVLPAKAQTNDLVAADFPQGSGFGTVTLTAAGGATFSATLADGTVVTASAPLSKDLTIPLYSQLYALKAGSFAGLVTLDDTRTDSDLKAVDCAWFRPWSNTQHYPWGWDEGVKLNLLGAKYQPTGLSTNVLLEATNLPSPNTVLTFTDGLLANPVSKFVNVSPANVVTKFASTDTSFSLSLVASTGKISGTFPHTLGATGFQGIVFQKGTGAGDEVQTGGHGFFLTLAAKPITGEGASGKVTVTPNLP